MLSLFAELCIGDESRFVRNLVCPWTHFPGGNGRRLTVCMFLICIVVNRRLQHFHILFTGNRIVDTKIFVCFRLLMNWRNSRVFESLCLCRTTIPILNGLPDISTTNAIAVTLYVSYLYRPRLWTRIPIMVTRYFDNKRNRCMFLIYNVYIIIPRIYFGNFIKN